MKIQLLKTLAVDDTNVLATAASTLQRAPDDGEYRVWVGSDQADGLLGINCGGRNVVESSNMPVEAVGALVTQGTPHYDFPVSQGEEVIINYNEVTGGTATILVQFLDEVELMREQGFTEAEIEDALAEED